jgi:hypothetical protein
VASAQIGELDPLCVGFSTVDFRQFDPAKPLDVVINPDAARYESGTMYRPAVKGFAASVGWLHDEVGIDNALSDIAELSQYCRARAGELGGTTVPRPPGSSRSRSATQMLTGLLPISRTLGSPSGACTKTMRCESRLASTTRPRRSTAPWNSSGSTSRSPEACRGRSVS